LCVRVIQMGVGHPGHPVALLFTFFPDRPNVTNGKEREREEIIIFSFFLSFFLSVLIVYQRFECLFMAVVIYSVDQVSCFHPKMGEMASADAPPVMNIS